ncbi:PREDICTED: cytochrome b5-like [Papilio xuthus]|uniref:Cytochrome b5-like n=1 Tax=Papilio xuthus TaxID=66420 RepID=A0AAJ7EGR4_PAPXU|nr:PREDICTED: cytochrome b5-like [Papilio xuthus]
MGGATATYSCKTLNGTMRQNARGARVCTRHKVSSVGAPARCTMAPVRFTRKEIALRNSEDDAVVIIDNVVCDLTRFLLDHPGGVEPLMELAGKDASDAFHEVGHSEYARDWMMTFAIGEVVEEERRAVLPWPPSVIDEQAEQREQGGPEGGSTWTTPLLLALVIALLSVYSYLWPQEP